MRWENIKQLFGIPEDPVVDSVQDIEPRALNARELDLISSILHLHEEWKNLDLSTTRVVAEGYYGRNGTDFRTLLQSPALEIPVTKPDRDGVGQLWINLDDGSVINAQLTQSEGHLDELYLIYVNTRHPKRRLPDAWNETSREVAPM
jgi:hypothetical protein